MADRPRRFADSQLENYNRNGAFQYPINHVLNGGDDAEKTEHQEAKKHSVGKDQIQDATLPIQKKKIPEADSDTERGRTPRSDDDGREVFKLCRTQIQINVDDVNSNKLAATSGRVVKNDKLARRPNGAQGDRSGQRREGHDADEGQGQGTSRAGPMVKGKRSMRYPRPCGSVHKPGQSRDEGQADGAGQGKAAQDATLVDADAGRDQGTSWAGPRIRGRRSKLPIRRGKAVHNPAQSGNGLGDRAGQVQGGNDAARFKAGHGQVGMTELPARWGGDDGCNNDGIGSG